MSSYRRYYLPSVSWSDVKGGVWRIQPYNVTDYFFIFRVQNLLTSAFFTQLAPISRLVIGGFLDNVKKSPNLFQHGYLQLENFSGKLKIPPTYHRKPVKQSNKNLYAIP